MCCGVTSQQHDSSQEGVESELLFKKDTQGGGLRRSTKVELGTGVLPDVKKNRAAQPYQNSEQYPSLPGKKAPWLYESFAPI